MAIAVESVGSQDWANRSSLDIPAPSGLSDGDLMVACIGSLDTASISTQSGWTLAEEISQSDSKINVQYKIADSTDAASSTFSFPVGPTTPLVTGCLYRITGFATDIVLDVSDSVSGSVPLSTSLTPNYPTSLIVLAFTTGGTDAHPNSLDGFSVSESVSFTKVFGDSIDSGSTDPTFGTAHGTYSSKTTLTSFGYDSNDEQSGSVGAILLISQADDDSGTTNLHTPTTSITDLDGSSGTNGTINMEMADVEFFDTETEDQDDIWTNQGRSSLR